MLRIIIIIIIVTLLKEEGLKALRIKDCFAKISQKPPRAQRAQFKLCETEDQ